MNEVSGSVGARPCFRFEDLPSTCSATRSVVNSSPELLTRTARSCASLARRGRPAARERRLSRRCGGQKPSSATSVVEESASGSSVSVVDLSLSRSDRLTTRVFICCSWRPGSLSGGGRHCARLGGHPRLSERDHSFHLYVALF